MKKTRRSFLKQASALSALAVGASGVATAADCAGVSAWDSSVAYSGGDQVTYDGSLWTAEWWTQGTEPAESKSVWTLEGACSGSGGGSDDGGSGVDCSGVSAYDSSTAYSGGDQVTYDGSLWTAEWWTQGTAPAQSENVWTLEGSCSDGGGGGGNEAPTASFTTNVTTPEPGESVTFDASGSADSDGPVSSYSWDFGDGATATGETVTHSYSSAGDYTVTLTVTDDAGGTDSASTTVSVSGGNAAPDASFTVSPSSPSPGSSATFDAADSSDSDGSITSYEWGLGDGTTATGQSVTHTYDAAGDYTVTLTVTDDAGATDSNSTTVTVGSDSGGGGATGETEFAPYNYVFTDPDTTMVEHAEQAGNEAFTAAFVLSDGNGNAAWGGDLNQLVGEAGLQSEFQAYQDQGGTIIVSFGGAVGTMIAQDTTDIEKIKAEYQSVIDTYGVTHLDFDIESVDEAAVDRRNQALAELQSENPDLKVSYTLRCRTTGLTSHGTYVVESARDNGVDLQYVNVMTMNYGWVRPSASTVKDTANGTYDDLTSIFPDLSADEAWSMVGLTPMLGENNVGGEHRISDAEAVVNFVQDKGVGLVSFWSIDRDNGDCPDGTVSGSCSGIAQEPYEFSNVYNEVQ